MVSGKQDQASTAFRAIDKDNSGFLDKDEFKRVLVELGSQPMTDKEFAAVWKNVDENKDGKIVSKKRSAVAKKNYAGSALQKWAAAVVKARKELRVTGFVAVGGKTATGKALYAKAKSFLN